MWAPVQTKNENNILAHVAASSNQYSCMRSSAPRFPRDANDGTPFGVYDLDSTTNKKSLESRTRGAQWE